MPKLYQCPTCFSHRAQVVRYPVTDKSCPNCGESNKEYVDKKYYFITYEYYRRPMKNWERSNAVMDKHPVMWLRDMNEEFQDSGEERHILFWDEITKEQYDYINGWVD